jgi:hypothetical protein
MFPLISPYSIGANMILASFMMKIKMANGIPANFLAEENNPN